MGFFAALAHLAQLGPQPTGGVAAWRRALIFRRSALLHPCLRQGLLLVLLDGTAGRAAGARFVQGRLIARRGARSRRLTRRTGRFLVTIPALRAFATRLAQRLEQEVLEPQRERLELLLMLLARLLQEHVAD